MKWYYAANGQQLGPFDEAGISRIWSPGVKSNRPRSSGTAA